MKLMASDDELTTLRKELLGPSGTVDKFIKSIVTVLERVSDDAATVTWKAAEFSFEAILQRVQGDAKGVLQLSATITRPGKRDHHPELKEGLRDTAKVNEWLAESLAASANSPSA